MIPEYVGHDAVSKAKGKEFWNISVGVRKKDKERMEKIQAALDRNADKIIKILDDYGIPHVPVVEEGKGKNPNKERGAVVPKTE